MNKYIKYHNLFVNKKLIIDISSRSNYNKFTLGSKCLRSDRTIYRTLYVVEKYFNRNYSDEMKNKIDTIEGCEIYSRGVGIAEPVFGKVRSCKNLYRITLRTKNKVNIQWVLYTIVQNIEKINQYGALDDFVVIIGVWTPEIRVAVKLWLIFQNDRRIFLKNTFYIDSTKFMRGAHCRSFGYHVVEQKKI